MRKNFRLEEKYGVENALPVSIAGEPAFAVDIFSRFRYNAAMNVYLDYAATSPLLPEVREEMLPVLFEHFGNPDSLHSFGRKAAEYVTAARDRVAAVLGVQPAEVYFTSGGTEADNWAIRCLGRGGAAVSAIEHAAVLSALDLRAGEHVLIPVTTAGMVAPEALSRSLTLDMGIVSVMAVNNETGTIQPVAELAALAHARGALFFCDCVQAACSADLKEIASSVDALSLSAHKLGGPKGAGALIVKKGARLSPLIAGGEQERALRGGTVNVAGAVGLACALELAARRREEFFAHTLRLRNLFEETLFAALGDGVRTDGEHRAPNISHLTFARGGAALLSALDLKGVAASGGAACSAHAALPSHVLVAMGRSEREAKQGVRFSFGLQTTEEETLFAARAVLSSLPS